MTLWHSTAISEQRSRVRGRSPADGTVVNVLNPPVRRDLVVVGTGIVGASVAYHAARTGGVVTLVDAGRPAAA